MTATSEVIDQGPIVFEENLTPNGIPHYSSAEKYETPIDVEDMYDSTTSSPLRVIFLSSDTGGGHRASAQALIDQFQLQYPDFEYEIVDLITDYSWPPYNSMVEWYKHLSSHPRQWKWLYKVSNTRVVESSVKLQFHLTMERIVRDVLMKKEPHVVISVHPLMTHLPAKSCSNISRLSGRHLPMFTVVTDLGGGHNLWFAGHENMEKVFIASSSRKMMDCATEKNKVPVEKLVLSGLPIRYEFQEQATQYLDNNRYSEKGKEWRRKMKQKILNLDNHDENNPMVILAMGGGEGVGSLDGIVTALYEQLNITNFETTEEERQVKDIIILVVCGRNQQLKESLMSRDWNAVSEKSTRPKHFLSQHLPNLAKRFRKDKLPLLSFKRNDRNELMESINSRECSQPNDGDADLMLGKSSTTELQSTEDLVSEQTSNTDDNICNVDIRVRPLGFITNMAEYMVAADVLVTKAGPGTIAEAASVGLPCMLTSFLPGQEENNIDFVVNENKFGEYDENPSSMAKTVCSWLQNPTLLEKMSAYAHSASNPNAAEQIVRYIGKSTQRWIELNAEETP